MINLTNLQLQDAISNLLNEEKGLSKVLEMTLNGLMFAERSEFLSKERDSGNKGNGYRGAKAIGMGKEIRLSVPRDRHGVFEPVILALIRDQEQHLYDISFDLYGKGLTTIQIGELTQKIYGRHYSSSSISRITKTFYSEMEAWRNRGLEEKYLAVYIDAIHVKVRRETVSSEAFYIMLGLKEDYTREVIAITNIPTESASGWKDELEILKSRGVKKVGLFIGDGLSSLENSIHQVFPESYFQKCVVHFKRNILNKVKSKHKAEVAEGLKEVFAMDKINDTRNDALTRLKAFSLEWGKLYKHIDKLSHNHLYEYYFTYLDFNHQIWRMIYTTNWIERLNKDFRRSLKIRNALPSAESALTLITKVAVDKEDKNYHYPIHNFKKDLKLKEIINLD